MVGNLVFWHWFGYLPVYKQSQQHGLNSSSSLLATWLLCHYMCSLHYNNLPCRPQTWVQQDFFPQRILQTTMDFDCPERLDYFCGGFRFQAVHNLFPRAPRHDLRWTQKLVQQFCHKVGIPNALYGFICGNRKVVGRLAEVTRQAAILARCQRTIGEGNDFIIHGRWLIMASWIYAYQSYPCLDLTSL